MAQLAHAQLTKAQGVTQYDSLIGNYNLITFGDAYIHNYGDTEGALAVGKNLYIDGGVIASKQTSASSSPTLYVGGTLKQTNSKKFGNPHDNLVDSAGKELQLKSGFSSVGNFAGAAAPTSWHNVKANTLTSWVNPTKEQTAFSNISSSLASAGTTGAIKVVGQALTFTPTITNGVAIFNLDMSLMNGNYYNQFYFSSVSFNIASGTTYVVNVLNGNGKTLFDSTSINFSGSGYDNLLWNIVDTKGTTNDNITFGSSEFYGSILASTYTVYNSSNTKINGQIVANSIYYDYKGCQSANELHFTGFDVNIPEGDLPPTPEPSTYGLIGAVFCLGFAGFSRWSKQRATAKAA